MIADMWVDLADEQRAFDSHLLAEGNRDLIREAIGRGIVAGTVLVARSGDGDDREDRGDGDDREDRNDRGAGGVDAASPDDARAEEPRGFVMFSVESGRYGQDVSRGVVDNLYVRPGARDRGIGAELLAAAERTLREAGVDAVSLDAMAGNEGARRFYRRHGYAPHRIEYEKELDGPE